MAMTVGMKDVIAPALVLVMIMRLGQMLSVHNVAGFRVGVG